MPAILRNLSIALAVLGATAPGVLSAADQTYPTALGATDDAVIAGGVPTAVTATQVKIGGGQLATGGNVGVGGLSGGDRLDVFGSTRLRGNTAVTVPAATDGSASVTVTGTGTIGMGFNATAATNAYGAPAGSLYLGGTNGQNLALTTMGVERVRIGTSGNVGIGATPTSRLTVQDSAYPASFTGTGTTIGIGNGILNGQHAKLTFGNASGNYGGIGLQVTGGGSFLELGTSNNFASGITNTALVIDPAGNVGIGATPVAGQGQLQLQPGAGDVVVRLNGGKTSTGEGSAFVCGQGGGYNQALGNWSGVIGGAFDNMGILFSATGWKFTTGGTAVRMYIDSAGNIGMGTASPSNVLHVASATNLGGRFDIATVNGATGAANLVLGNGNTTAGNATGIEFANAGGGYSAFISGINTNHNPAGSQSGGLDFAVFNAGAVVRAMTIAPSGSVGIGIANPTSALAVNGVISAREVLVVANPADYVFADGYRLRPLAEVEAFIAAHKHLPGVPSAHEQEEKGEMVADLMRAHLEKIEELNLYVIQQQKVIDDLVAQQKARDKSFAEVLARLAALEGRGRDVK